MNKDRVEQMYIELINEYGGKLPPEDKEPVKGFLMGLHRGGYPFSWIYWAIWNLGERRIKENEGLFHFLRYKEEVYKIEKKAAALYLDNMSYSDMIWAFPSSYHEASEEDYERMYRYDDSFNIADEGWELSPEEKAEVEELYLRNCVKPCFSISKEEWWNERQSVIKQLKSINKFIDYKKIPPHPYTDDEEETPPPIPREKDKLGLYYKTEE